MADKNPAVLPRARPGGFPAPGGEAGSGPETTVKLFCLAFGFGFGFNSLVAEGAKWGERRGPGKDVQDRAGPGC